MPAQTLPRLLPRSFHELAAEGFRPQGFVLEGSNAGHALELVVAKPQSGDVAFCAGGIASVVCNRVSAEAFETLKAAGYRLVDAHMAGPAVGIALRRPDDKAATEQTDQIAFCYGNIDEQRLSCSTMHSVDVAKLLDEQYEVDRVRATAWEMEIHLRQGQRVWICGGEHPEIRWCDSVAGGAMEVLLRSGYELNWWDRQNNVLVNSLVGPSSVAFCSKRREVEEPECFHVEGRELSELMDEGFRVESAQLRHDHVEIILERDNGELVRCVGRNGGEEEMTLECL